MYAYEACWEIYKEDSPNGNRPGPNKIRVLLLCHMVLCFAIHSAFGSLDFSTAKKSDVLAETNSNK